MKSSIIITKSIDELSDKIAEKLFELKKQKEDVHIALSGGSTPKAIFEYLTKKYGGKLKSSNFHFWWGDDRCVPPGHDDSNYKWAKYLWLDPIGIKEENIHRVLGESNPQEEALRYSTEINNFLPNKNGLPVFDYIILGIGEDGHTASIFPHQMNLLSSDKICEVATHPDNGQKRITLTGKLINNAKEVAFLATGRKKATKVFEIIKKGKTELPASHIQPLNGKLVWLIDQEAAASL